MIQDPKQNQPLRWSVTLWHSSMPHGNWRHWKLLYTNRELDSVLKRSSSEHVGLQGGEVKISGGFDEDHLSLFFEKVFKTKKMHESVMRFSHPEDGVDEVYLLFYMLLLDDHHIGSFFVPIDPSHVPEQFDTTIYHPPRGPSYYGLPQSLRDDLEKEIERLRAMLPE